MINDTLKQIEEEILKKSTEIYIGSGSDLVINTKHAIAIAKSSIIKVLEQLVEREEKSKKEYLRYIDTYGITNEEVDGWNGKIEDTISYLKSEIANLSTNIDKE
jgi:hypothetical protein